MHLGKFHYAISTLSNQFTIPDVGSKIQAVIQQLDSLAANPGHPNIAAAFKENLEALRKHLGSSTLNKPYPTLAALLDSIGARKYVGDELFQQVENVISENGMTPQLAATALRKLLADVTEFYLAVEGIDIAFTKLEVEYERLEPGQGEIGISIPEPVGERLLTTLADTAKAWDKALRPFVELADPEHNPIAVRTISSSDWQFYLTAATGVYLAFSGAVGRLNELLIKLIETKKLLIQLTGIGVSANAIATVAAESDAMLDVETRKLGEKIVEENLPTDPGRANELKTAMTASLKFMARQMAENVKIEVRYLPPKPPKTDVPSDQQLEDATNRVEELTELAAQVERNMDIVRLDDSAREILNLPAPEEEIE